MSEEKKIMDSRGQATFEIYHRRKDGTFVPLEVSSRKVEIEGISYYQSICRDITEGNRWATLRQSEEDSGKFLKKALKHCDDGAGCGNHQGKSGILQNDRIS